MVSGILVTSLLAFVNVMPLGDSITTACHDATEPNRSAYRVLIQDELRAHGVGYDFTGPLTGGCPPGDFDADHAGHRGLKIDEVSALVPDLMQTYNPDVVLLLAGTNNHFDPPFISTFRESYSQLLDSIGDRQIYIATVPKFGYDVPEGVTWTESFINHRNEVIFPLMNKVIFELAASRPHVHVVDYFNAFDPTLHLIEDQVHPNLAGQQLLADLFWHAAFQYDFDRSGKLDPADVDLLSQAILQGSSDLRFDVNGSGYLEEEDRHAWLKEYRRVPYGDANFDGYFDSSDLLKVLRAGKFESSSGATWETGDWDGDRRFTSADLLWALREGSYGSTIPVGSRAVPESGLAWWLAPLGFALFRRRIASPAT